MRYIAAEHSADGEQMEMSMPQNRTERRIVKVDYEEITRVIEFKIFAVQPDGKKGRVVGGGAFEEQDLDRVVHKLAKLAEDFVFNEGQMHGFFQEIEEGEGEDG
jgi:hypothetical protein